MIVNFVVLVIIVTCLVGRIEFRLILPNVLISENRVENSSWHEERTAYVDKPNDCKHLKKFVNGFERFETECNRLDSII